MEAAISVTDDSGCTLTLEQPARRVVALYGALAELALALDAGDRLAGRTAADGEIAALAHLPAVGTHMRPQPELVAALRPDVVVQMVGRREVQDMTLRLRQAGIPVMLFRMGTFEEIFSTLRRLGLLLGREDAAAALEQRWRQRLAAVEQAVAGRPRPAVFYEVRYPNLLGAGRDSIVYDIVTRAGGRLVAGSAGRVARTSEEEVIRQDPDWYILQQGPMNPVPLPLSERPHFAGLRAVRQGQVLVVEERAFARPGAHAVDAVEMLARILYPDLFQGQRGKRP